ncbi:TfoX/Sxy family protein [Octadecabacter sp. 1_MG-2023]|uniref:TfoX/Sxy family protein n=1 Tax=unclassified Octadecabacter TaxID=196158 RepID=UPI001C0A3532|nr:MULTISPECIES: TfoX/Sxy family protein [unclassified Octadecabacter]MBU2993581.1 TfoX/Sxy family protein [Octadecabacter sp. B2R22]MDO6735575.1 TfoX/Sxy family protein [Octadecabacter sp. 1_MG-2023]
MAAISTIRNIGPASEALYNAAGIMTAEALHEMGADAAYAKLLSHGNRPHFIGYYALHMALQGRPWNDCQGEEKKALRKTFDALKAAHFNVEKSEIDAFMDEIGLIDRR